VGHDQLMVAGFALTGDVAVPGAHDVANERGVVNGQSL